jgi:predicted phosphodiesterase
MKLLCISDIHGRADLLDRVLDFGRRQACTSTLVAGDLCFPGPEPLKTWKMLMDAKAHLVRGVSDLAVGTMDPDKLKATTPEQEARLERLRACRAELGEVILTRLARLPTSFRLSLENGGELLLVHGSPRDPTTALTHDMEDDEFGGLVGDSPADIVVCGASHVPFERTYGTTRIVNVGSVGEAPSAGCAHAAVIETSNVGLEVRLITLASRDA